MKPIVIILISATLAFGACQKRQFGYLSKVKVKHQPPKQVPIKETAKSAAHDKPLYEALNPLIPTPIIEIDTKISKKQAVKLLPTYCQKEIIETPLTPIQQKAIPKPERNRLRDNKEAKVALLLTIFHFISLFPLGELFIGGAIKADDWAISLVIMITTGFSMIILYFAIKGLNNYLTNTIDTGYFVSILTLLYGIIFFGLFIMYFLFLLKGG